MRRKKQKSHAGTQLELFKRQERRKRKSWLKGFCNLFNKDKNKAKEEINEETPLFI